MVDPEYLRYFPYEEPYQNQREAMDRIEDALDGGTDVLFEGAPGTGKTLAALAPALEHARSTDRTVVITTNVRQQMRQFVAEARAIVEQEPIRAVVFRGKASMCHIGVDYRECQVLRDNTYDLVEKERDRAQLERRSEELLRRMQGGDDEAAEARGAVMEELDALESEVDELRDRNTCSHYYRNFDSGEAFERWLFEDVRTPDDVYEWAEEHGTCGYELLKDAMDGVDLVVCNYHHLLDPGIRTQFFRWLDRDPDEVVAVFDEAHNVERVAREHAGREIAEGTLTSALDELDGVDDPRAGPAENVVRAFRDALVETYEVAIGSRELGAVGEDWTDVPVASDDRRDDLTLAFLRAYSGRGVDADLEDAMGLGDDLAERYEEAYREGTADVRRECQTRQVAGFVRAYLDAGTEPGQFPIVSVRRGDAGDVYGRAELYACFPREVTRGLLEEVHAAVLMSATLRPFDVTADVLGLDEVETMAFGLPFPEENRRTLAVDVPPLFAADRDDPALQSTVTEVLADAIEFTPGNVLAFFPSYAEAARYADRLDSMGDCCPVYLDEPGAGVQELKESFVDDGDAALFSSLWGTLAEGVSFDGEAARTVIVVGVPYPNLDDRARAVEDAYERAFPGNGWEYAIEVPTVRKVRQALGRALRSPSEVGARVLVDRRYTAADMGEYGVREVVPADERDEFVDVAPGKLKFSLLNFYADHGAWDGSRPTP